MIIDEKEVKHIAKLARLYLEEKEIKKMGEELSLILDYFNSLKNLDVDNIKVDFDLINKQKNLPLKEITRKDIVIKGDNNEKIKELIPEKQKGFVKVKSILDKQNGSF